MIKMCKVVRVVFIQICLWMLLVSMAGAMETAANCLTGPILRKARVDRWSDKRVSSIDLSGLGLEGKFPNGVKECSSLTSLNLSGNNFSGTLPSDLFAFLPYLVTLDLSYNNFSGEIPSTWSNAAYLNVLLLDHNRFTGQIPLGLASSPRLKRFSVAHNNLNGPIPEFANGNFPLSSFEDNLDLCGFPLDDPCPDPFFLVSMNVAAIVAAIFFPVGAAIGWFYVGRW